MLILASVCLCTAAPAQPPPTGCIGLYMDESRTLCSLDAGSGYTPFSFYIFCLPSENGMMCAEFAVSIPSDIIISNIQENDRVSVALGNLSDGMSVCFLECQTDWIYTHRVDAVAQSPSPCELLLIGHGKTGEIQFANCDDGFPLEPLFVNPGIGINGPCADDLDPPGLADLSGPDTRHLLLAFDEEVFAADAVIASNYVVVNLNNPNDRINVSSVFMENVTPTRVMLTLERSMAGDGSYSLFVSEVRDRAGNKIPSGSHVDVDLGFDITPPKILGVDVISDLTLILRFSEPLNSSIAEDRFQYLLSGPNGGELIVKAEYLAASTSVRVTLKHELMQKVVYSMLLYGITDLAGNVIGACSSISFRAIDKSPPALLSVVAFDADHVTALFDEPLDTLSSTDSGNYLVFDSADPDIIVPIQGIEILYPDRVMISLAYALDEDTSYSVFVSGVSDIPGNAIPDTGITDIVKRPVKGAPYIVSVEYSKTSIPPHIEIVFNEPILYGDKKEAYRLFCVDQPGVLILFRDVSWISAGTAVFGQLVLPLDEERLYDIGLSPLKDLEGNTAPEGYRIRFDIKDPEVPDYSIAISDGEVKIDWELSRCVGEPSFLVSRSDAADGVFSELPLNGMSGEGLLFTYRDQTAEQGKAYIYRIDYMLGEELFNCFMTREISIYDPLLSLNQNRPNPFNPSTTLSWSQPGEGDVLMEIFDVAGRRVVVLEKGFKSAGYHSIEWDGKNSSGNIMSSGIYFYRLSYGGTVRTRKMVLLR